ncbi:hypothetical protein [uncultured Cytophaga sp.]|uniref:hypothetical protein n=1 Tax=uncultured Cytophaga sp. TaxID=160238 RepID=UPI00262B1D94|nr:hypothetical protein [uncultured Cytophaga sp.]
MRKLRNKSGFTNDKEIVKTLLKKDSSTAINPYFLNKANASFNRNGLLYNTTVRNFEISDIREKISHTFSETSFNQIKTLTTDFGIKQNNVDSNLNIYALDDNAMALVIMCDHFELNKTDTDLELIDIYLGFIEHCLQPSGYFYKFVDADKKFTDANSEVNLADTTGCAIWALGYLISKKKVMPKEIIEKAEAMFQNALQGASKIHSVYAISLLIKGLYFNNKVNESIESVWLIKKYAGLLVDQYKLVETENWKWFQRNVSINASVISEALLCAWMATGEPIYKTIAKTTFDFLLMNIFKNEQEYSSFLKEEKMFSGKKSSEVNTIIFSLNTFYKIFKEEQYLIKMQRSADWLNLNKSMQCK